MKKFEDFAHFGETDWMIVFTDKAPEDLRGKKLPIFGPDRRIVIRFDAKLNLKDKVVVERTDPEYDNCDGVEINELVRQGIVEEWHPSVKERGLYKEAYLFDALSKEKFVIIDECGKSPNYDAIIRYFAERGFNVSRKALEYCFDAWRGDFKSAYRDEANGVHVFVPCGCNPFNITISELHESCKNWQKTYYC